jgi:pimeloyl-CoA synthetase
MHLKMFVLSASAVALWLAPLTALDKKVSWHKAAQGVSLCAGIACAIKAGSIAHKLSEEAEIEMIKERAITADVVDEIATSAYVSQQQRQQEAELILTSPGVDVEAQRKALEATYSNDLQNSLCASDHPDYLVYLEVCKSQEAGKSVTWIVENVLKMGGRRFADGKIKLETLLQQFEKRE